MVHIAIIGGSAGSLAEIQTILESVPNPAGLALVIIQHLSPNHRSQLDTLVEKWTELPVALVKEGMSIVSDHVYLAPPGYYIGLKENVFQLYPSNTYPKPHYPIDFFCNTLDTLAAKHAVLVVVSGTGRDGTEGAKSIKRSNGIVIVQEPSEAEFPSMPKSVIDSIQFDRIAPTESVGQLLSLWATGSDIHNQQLVSEAQPSQGFNQILDLVQAHSRKDLTGYKQSTLKRRIERRMGLHQAASIEKYVEILKKDTPELDQLSKDLLIGVTSFFRDPDAFEVLEQLVIPQICQNKSSSDPVRVWVAGCSTGEEAYSVAILIHEWFIKQNQTPRIQIFATDVDSEALEIGRAGIFNKDHVENLTEDRIIRFFKAENQILRIEKSVRETIVFASHNVICDPPFSKLDLVVCRNLLIYLNNSTQRKLLGLFRFVINPNGFLFLGGSESIGGNSQAFTTVSKQWRIYQCKNKNSLNTPIIPLSNLTFGKRTATTQDDFSDFRALADREKIYRKILEIHGPTMVLINANSEVLFVSGDSKTYMNVPSGGASHDVYKMVVPGLAMPLRSAITLAQKEARREVVISYLSEYIGRKQPQDNIRIEVIPVDSELDKGLLLVSLSSEPQNSTALQHAESSGDDWVLQQLLQELSATREDLLRTIEQSRIANEEMRVANEEAMAMNEELQSANEELESSKEELQSLNEDLPLQTQTWTQNSLKSRT